MIRLLGARKFINLPAGTLYTEYWLNSTQECNEMVEKFIRNPNEFLDTSDLLIYQDNGASLILQGQKDAADIILTDINVVGDADPSTTLRVVFDLDDLPEITEVRGYEYDDDKDDCTKDYWSKQEILEVINVIKEDNYFGKTSDHWALEELERLHKEGNKIIDIEINI
jgi:hypothetical protein